MKKEHLPIYGVGPFYGVGIMLMCTDKSILNTAEK